jgi:raffinose/stachyose/melibiose transport system substrate-binding protein
LALCPNGGAHDFAHDVARGNGRWMCSVIPDWRGRKTYVVIAVGVLAAGTVLAGCSSISDTVTTLTFMQNKREVVQYFDGVIADFEAKNPDIRVIQDFNENNFVPSLIRDNPPDVVTRGSNSTTADFTERGIFADLSSMPVAATVDPNIQQLVNDWGQYNGQTAALPFSLTAAGVIYNKDIFAQYGVTVPTTWDEFVQACETFKANGVTPVYGTFKDGWTINQGAFDYAAGGLIDVQQFYDQLNAEGSSVGPESPVSFEKSLTPVTTAMQQLLSYSQPDAASRSYSDGNAAFAAGQAAMYLQGPWALSELVKANPNVNVGTFALPMTNNPDDTKARVNVDMALSIVNGTEHLDAAERFVTYLMQPDVINKFNAENAAFSTLADAPPQQNPQLAGLAPLIEAGKFYQGITTYLPASITKDNYVQAFAIDRDADAFLSTLDADWQRVAERTAK